MLLSCEHYPVILWTMQSLSKIWAISTPLHQLARCLIRYENTYAPENSFWSIIKLGNIGKDFGNVGKWLIFNNLFTCTYRYTCTETHLMRSMDERTFMQKKYSPLLFSFDSSLSFWRRKLVDFLFLSYGLNTKFEHRSMNTGACHWRLKRVGAELCSDLCSEQKKKQLRFDS